jgi:hypothetical protein
VYLPFKIKIINLIPWYIYNSHAMLVFPTLSQDLREQWEILEGRLINEEITNKVC